jgi:U3 small nucleolar RNA-associated protein 14
MGMQVDAPVMLPGWGAWNGMQKEPKFIRDKRIAAERERRKAEEGRRDKGKKAVAISEKYDKKASAFHTQVRAHTTAPRRQTNSSGWKTYSSVRLSMAGWSGRVGSAELFEG